MDEGSLSIWGPLTAVVCLCVGFQALAGVNISAGGDSPRFVSLKGGTFEMGSLPSESGDPDEKLHKVTLTRDFEIQTTEVTQLQYFSVMNRNPSRFKSSEHCDQSEYMEKDGISLCSNNPVENVSWYNVKSFIHEWNQNINDGYIYRLPTEAEWEYAARAGTTTAFNLGDNINTNVVNYNGKYPYKGAQKGIYRGQTTSVASLSNANKLGLYDMHGNVWEWVEDIYGDYPSGPVTDPLGASSGFYRIRRGGGWNNGAFYLRSADRFYAGPRYSFDDVGFRLVRVPSSQGTGN